MLLSNPIYSMIFLSVKSVYAALSCILFHYDYQYEHTLWAEVSLLHGFSLQKHSLLLALRRWGRFARRNVCDSATEILYWWRKICPESGQKRWLVDGVVTLKRLRRRRERRNGCFRRLAWLLAFTTSIAWLVSRLVGLFYTPWIITNQLRDWQVMRATSWTLKTMQHARQLC